ncbi:MAG TPA: flagellar hook capping FlgD N-terminal domain-containing protein [Nitrospirales bacterium]|nr:flagellar hook capping FlgD N-terminal domain-containing protein [Nitrospirales bacterium]
MSTSAVTSALNATILGGPSDSNVPQAKQLGQDDFLKLLTVQMQNQDPLKPMDNQEFIAQLAQFSQLQAASDQTKLLQQSLDQQATQLQFNLAPLVGRQVEVGTGLLQLGDTTPVAMQYSLDAGAATVTVQILDAGGNIVRTLDEGPQGAGAHEATWDGNNQAGVAMPQGSYQMIVAAHDAQGNAVTGTTASFATVTGVRMSNGQPLLLIGDTTVSPKDVLEFH